MFNIKFVSNIFEEKLLIFFEMDIKNLSYIETYKIKINYQNQYSKRLFNKETGNRDRIKRIFITFRLFVMLINYFDFYIKVAFI